MRNRLNNVILYLDAAKVLLNRPGRNDFDKVLPNGLHWDIKGKSSIKAARVLF